MAGAGKEILTKIRSVKNTQKITRAMQMVSTSKMRKTQERMRAARPYADKVRVVMAHLAKADVADALPILESREHIRRVGILVVTSDKGLCGGLNANVLKALFAKVQECQEQNIGVEVCCFGSKGLAACERAQLDVVSSAVDLGDTPKAERIIGPVRVLIERYLAGEIDAVYMVYSKFVNTMRQEPSLETLLPIGSEALSTEDQNGTEASAMEYVYEPDPVSVLEFLVRRYLESVVYQAMCDNMASEQAARMVAMKAATDNAGEAIKELQLVYNKSRQAAITTELSEIVAGAAAV
ncbi:MAG: F0F1 ATP synthase subunit gamma [Neisseriaceae bacterium]|nr:F0F1 ATP synthase subunit gamma [Neisseriaceae bacterium]MBP6862979.1 F0F1 ATP synthase subunit gamma [Neisseriaceae bacterium]